MRRPASGITREMLEADRLRTTILEHYPDTPVLDDTALKRSLEATLARRPSDTDQYNGVWVFGYGSLLWNPCIEVADRQPATLHGLHRDFCIRDTEGRGSPDRPGLTLALAPGGACRGAGLRVPEWNLRRELMLLWRREMVTDAYRPRWVQLRMAGGTIGGIAFVANQAHPAFAGRLPVHEIARLVTRARGPIGSSLEYLERTVEQLDREGIRDRRLLRLRTAARSEVSSPRIDPGSPWTDTNDEGER